MMVGNEGPERGVGGRSGKSPTSPLEELAQLHKSELPGKYLGTWHIQLSEWDREGQPVTKSPEGCCLCIQWWAWGSPLVSRAES